MKKQGPIPYSIELRLEEYRNCISIHHQDWVIEKLEGLGQCADAIIENKDRMIKELFPDIYHLVTDKQQEGTQS